MYVRLQLESQQKEVFQMECLALKVEDAAKLLHVGRTSTYAAVRRGEIPAVRIGGLWRVPRAALERMLAEAGRKEEVAA